MKVFATTVDWDGVDDAPAIYKEDQLEDVGCSDEDTEWLIGYGLTTALLALEIGQSLTYEYPFNGEQTWRRLPDVN